jgi:hypothetical protein
MSTHKRNRWVMGSAIGLAALAVAIDHTRHPLPQPQASTAAAAVEDQAAAQTPCGLTAAPCALDDTPCGLGGNPCSL